jgi:hypothetical protein
MANTWFCIDYDNRGQALLYSMSDGHDVPSLGLLTMVWSRQPLLPCREPHMTFSLVLFRDQRISLALCAVTSFKISN